MLMTRLLFSIIVFLSSVMTAGNASPAVPDAQAFTNSVWDGYARETAVMLMGSGLDIGRNCLMSRPDPFFLKQKDDPGLSNHLASSLPRSLCCTGQRPSGIITYLVSKTLDKVAVSWLNPLSQSQFALVSPGSRLKILKKAY